MPSFSWRQAGSTWSPPQLRLIQMHNPYPLNF
jgi:hypothetical protein